MKPNIKLRSLTCLTFVIFFLPFMRTCSAIEVSDIESEMTTPINDESIKSPIQPKIRQEHTVNFYSISALTVDNFKLENLSDTTFSPLFGFTVILIFSITILFLAFKNKFKIIFILSISNLVILFISTLTLCFAHVIEGFNQIKIGYYLFVINTLLIIYFSKKMNRKVQNSDFE